MMKPILFNTRMVRAILSGRKTQTRRVIKEAPGACMFCGCTDMDCRKCIKRTGEPCSWVNKEETICSACADFPTDRAKYQSGDILWVRETFAPSNHPIHRYAYKASIFNTGLKMKWKPSIYMPKAACRIFLEVTNLRVERLQNITEKDAVAEGVKKHSDYGSTGYIHYGEPDKAYTDIDAVWSFETLWESIYGKGSWSNNPWVWVYEFERCQNPGNF